MNKVYGLKSGYSPVRYDRTRTIVCYGMEEVDATHATWYEVYYYKKQIPVPSLEMIKNDIINEINAQTDEKILKECPWTVLHGEDAGKHVKLWLNAENQRNYSEEQRVAQMTNGANLPAKVKVSENEDKTVVYDIFETVEEITQFYLAGVNFIKTTINEGWVRKDSIDWASYKVLFSEPKPEPTAGE